MEISAVRMGKPIAWLYYGIYSEQNLKVKTTFVVNFKSSGKTWTCYPIPSHSHSSIKSLSVSSLQHEAVWWDGLSFNNVNFCLLGRRASRLLQEPRRRDRCRAVREGHRGWPAQDHRRLRRLLQGLSQRQPDRGGSQWNRLHACPGKLGQDQLRGFQWFVFDKWKGKIAFVEPPHKIDDLFLAWLPKRTPLSFIKRCKSYYKSIGSQVTLNIRWE